MTRIPAQFKRSRMLQHWPRCLVGALALSALKLQAAVLEETIVTAQRALAKHQRVVFSVRGHVIGFHNAETSDWADNRRHHIRGAHIFRQQAA